MGFFSPSAIDMQMHLEVVFLWVIRAVFPILLRYLLLHKARDTDETLRTPASLSLIEWRCVALSGNSPFDLEISAVLLLFHFDLELANSVFLLNSIISDYPT